MLDELCPVQFVEGINECVKSLTRSSLLIEALDYPAIAIKYRPKSTYSLKFLAIFLAQEALSGAKFKLALWTDYNNNPSDIELSNGEWVGDSKRGFSWQEVTLNRAIVVVNTKQYWLSIERNDNADIILPIPEVGDELDIRFKIGKRWELNEHFKTHKVMLRFYGRVVPVIGQSISN